MPRKPKKANRDHISFISTQGYKGPFFAMYPFKAKLLKKVNEPMYFTNNHTDREILQKTGGVRIQPLKEAELKIIDQSVKSRKVVDIQDFLEGVCNVQNSVEMSWDEILERLQAYQRRAKQTDSGGKTAGTERKAEGSMLMITVRSNKDIWEAIKSEYDISKMTFGKKINFVSDSFKRKIIFRDVEHAFVLASQGFSKPALILAGGVIEELLRLYLVFYDFYFYQFIVTYRRNAI
jgi:predicted GIY-YIG superfamily endonuclease